MSTAGSAEASVANTEPAPAVAAATATPRESNHRLVRPVAGTGSFMTGSVLYSPTRMGGIYSFDARLGKNFLLLPVQ
jgi:hypothetical protein